MKTKNTSTHWIILKQGQDTNVIPQDVINKTGMAPSFYLRGTKMIVNHTLDLDFLKWINDQDGKESALREVNLVLVGPVIFKILLNIV
ncbi:MAG TPA: hypothetical protein VJ772_06110 [Nitrososphaeraceae archaeon]|nr:hypothetical protein [Nitrososphaeraceae archaeon]